MDINKPVAKEDNRVKPGEWGESKQRWQVMLTSFAVDLADSRAEALGITRSEFLERSIRWIDAHWDTQMVRDLGGDRNEF